MMYSEKYVLNNYIKHNTKMQLTDCAMFVHGHTTKPGSDCWIVHDSPGENEYEQRLSA